MRACAFAVFDSMKLEHPVPVIKINCKLAC